MDGRVQLPVINWLKENYQADYVDMITQSGPIKLLSENKEPGVVAAIKRCVEISVERHGSCLVAVVGHYDCAGNPVGKEEQLKQIAAAIEVVRGWGVAEKGVEVIGLWVDALGGQCCAGKVRLGQVGRVI